RVVASCVLSTLTRLPADSTLFPYTTLFRSIARLLQSLDADGNLLNGIQISAAMDEAIGDYVEAQGLQGLDFNDADAFEHAMTGLDRKSTRLNSSHVKISYAVFCFKKHK